PPDLVLAEHSPTAVLSGRILGIPTARIGVPYTMPPAQNPLPELIHWDPLPESERLKDEERPLANINRALGEAGCDPLPHLGALFATDEDFVCSFAELDGVAAAGGEPRRQYWGPVTVSFTGSRPQWPSGEGPRLLAVLDAAYRDL